MTRVFRRPFLWLDDLRASAEKGTTIAALDGVRGFAALIVLASHTSFLGMTGQGSIGVWVFFTLSGFLLSQPFLAQPEPSIDRYARFMFRRARRILPAYWVTVLLLYAPSTGFNWSETWSNLVMLKAWGHLWSVKQELVLYCLLPLLLALAPSTSRKHVLYATFLLITALAVPLITPAYLTVEGNSKALPLYAAPFILGIAVAALQQSGLLEHFKCRKHLSDGIIIAFLLVVVFSSHNNRAFFTSLLGVANPAAHWGWTYYPVFAVVSAVFLFGVLLNGRLSGLLFTAAPVRAIGILGYGIYLVHYFTIPLLISSGLERGAMLFVAALALSFIAAALLYGFVERVFWTPTRYADQSTVARAQLLSLDSAKPA